MSSIPRQAPTGFGRANQTAPNDARLLFDTAHLQQLALHGGIGEYQDRQDEAVRCARNRLRFVGRYGVGHRAKLHTVVVGLPQGRPSPENLATQPQGVDVVCFAAEGGFDAVERLKVLAWLAMFDDA
jgi:hypothetical protein